MRESWSLAGGPAGTAHSLTAAATAGVQGRFINTTGEERRGEEWSGESSWRGAEEHRCLKENMEWEKG